MSAYLPVINAGSNGTFRNISDLGSTAGKFGSDASVSEIGKWLRQRRRSLGDMSAQELASRAGISEKTVRNYEKDGLPSDRAHYEKLDNYAKHLGLLTGAIDKLLRGELPSTDDLTNPEQGGLQVIAKGTNVPAVFSLGIAASGWVNLDQAFSAASAARGTKWIIIRVAGDSMEPRYLNGQHVMFHVLNPEEDSPVPGEDYFFARSDGHGTFKRLASVDEDGYELRALNSKYGNRLRVSKDEVVMVGEARFIVSDIPDKDEGQSP